MQQKGEGTKRQLFIDKQTTQQPLKLTNLQMSTSGTLFLNNRATIEDIPPHTMNFKYSQPADIRVTKINALNNFTSGGVFTVSGSIKWKGPAQRPNETSTKQVRDATLTDNSGSITLSIWGEHITQVTEEQFFTFTACKLRFYYGRCLTTTHATNVSKAEAQELSTASQEQLQSWICCPEVLNATVNAYPVCNNKDCRKKVSATPGTRVIKCIGCNRSMLLNNCYLDMNVSLQLEKDAKCYNLTAFPKVINEFLKEDIYIYKENTDRLVEKLLLLESVDFQLSTNMRLLVKMQKHESPEANTDTA